MNHVLNMLGIAKKAGLLAVGGEAATVAARNGKAKLVITATDASEGSVRRARTSAEMNGVIYMAVPFTKFEIGSITGRGSPGTAAFLDAGLAAGFVKKLSETNAETAAKHGEAIRMLERKAEARKKAQTVKRSKGGKKQ